MDPPKPRFRTSATSLRGCGSRKLELSIPVDLLNICSKLPASDNPLFGERIPHHDAPRACTARVRCQSLPFACVPPSRDPRPAASTGGLSPIDPAAAGGPERPPLLVVAVPRLVTRAGSPGLRATGDRARVAAHTLSGPLGPPQPDGTARPPGDPQGTPGADPGDLRGQFKAAMESHVSAWGSERTAMGWRSVMGKRTRAFPDKRTEKAGPPSSTADGETWMSRGSTR